MTVMGGSSSAPMAIPMIRCALTTWTPSPDRVRASTRRRSGWCPAPMRASASYSALRTSLAASRGSSSTRTTNETGPSVAESYPRSSSLRIHRGGMRTGGWPSMTRSTPSTIRPASRPGVTWTAHSASLSTRSVEIPMAFALRGAPCGDWAHLTALVRADNEENPSPGGRADHVPASLGGRVGEITIGQSEVVVFDRHRLRKADPVLAQVGLRLLGVPGVAHPGERSDGRSTASPRANPRIDRQPVTAGPDDRARMMTLTSEQRVDPAPGADPASSGATDRRPNDSGLQRRACSLRRPSTERTRAWRGGNVR